MKNKQPFIHFMEKRVERVEKSNRSQQYVVVKVGAF